MKEKLKKLFLANRLSKVTTKSSVVNFAILLAEVLGGYIGGSRRFIGQFSESSDLDVFFTKEEEYDSFINYLMSIGKQCSYTTPIFREEKKIISKKYESLKTKVVKVHDRDETHYVKGKYTVDGIYIDVSLVDIILSPEEEAEKYAENLLKKLEGKK